jgi:hypothetical protein
MKEYYITLSESLDIEEMLADSSPKSIFVIGMGNNIHNYDRLHHSLVYKFRNRATKLWDEIHKRREDPDRMIIDWREIEVSQVNYPSQLENSIKLERLLSSLDKVQNIKEIIFHSIDLEYFPMLSGSFAKVERIEFTDSTLGYFKNEMSEESCLRTIIFYNSFLIEFPSYLHIFPKLKHFLFNGNIGYMRSILKLESLFFELSLFHLANEEFLQYFKINYKESNDREHQVKILNRA